MLINQTYFYYKNVLSNKKSFNLIIDVLES